MLDANIKAQLQSYFTKLRRPIVLKAALDGSQDATNIEALLQGSRRGLSDKISYEVESERLRSPSQLHSRPSGRSRRHSLRLPPDGP